MLLASAGALAEGPDCEGNCVLAWDPPLSGTVRGYHMRCSPDAGGADPLVFELANVLTTTTLEMGLAPGQWYCRVRAFNTGQESESSNQLPFEVPQLGNPQNLRFGV